MSAHSLGKPVQRVTVSVEHTFEAGHRLRHIPGKCQSLHGHSWRVVLTVAAPATHETDGTIVMFGDLKKRLREFVDGNLDHGMMLGAADPLLEAIRHEGKTKLFVFGGAEIPVRLGSLRAQEFADDLAWPTVENVATLLARAAQQFLPDCGPVPGAYVARVEVSETPTNTASWEAVV